LQKFDHFFAACEMIALNRVVFEQATRLRARNQLKTSDALHLAAAIHAGYDELWTNDQQLKSTASQLLNVLDWSALDAMK
jgi:predicted nucleic acid-binding protein